MTSFRAGTDRTGVHLFWLDKMFELAQNVHQVQSARLAAGLVYKNHLIAVGINQRKSHPLQAKYSKNESSIFLHAEISCLVSAQGLAKEYFPKSIMYISRAKYDLDKQGDIKALAKPCAGCEKALQDFRIGKVIWTV